MGRGDGSFTWQRMRKATIGLKSFLTSEKAKPRTVAEKSYCFREGFLAEATMRFPNTTPTPVSVATSSCGRTWLPY